MRDKYISHTHNHFRGSRRQASRFKIPYRLINNNYLSNNIEIERFATRRRPEKSMDCLLEFYSVARPTRCKFVNAPLMDGLDNTIERFLGIRSFCNNNNNNAE